jgi:hypothetical protein
MYERESEEQLVKLVLNGFDSSLIKIEEKDSLLDEKDVPIFLSEDDPLKQLISFDSGKNEL